jgi:starch-binding outer membrane protein, SusD/RagB family
MKNTLYIALVLLLIATGCDKEYLNPSSASEVQVVSDINGLIALANGLQQKYSVGRASPNYTLPTTNGLLAKELTVLNAGNTEEEFLRLGGNSVIGSNAVITNLWNQSQLVRSNADLILNNLSIATDAGMKAGLRAHASIFKALAMGNLAMFWESAPITTGINAPFVSRTDILSSVITLLEQADADLDAALAVGPLPTAFTSRIVSGIDYVNTVNALIARYALMAGDYNKALTAAAAVSLSPTIKSGFNHDDAAQNALFFTSFSNRNVTEPFDASFALPAALSVSPSDGRINFFFNASFTGTSTSPNRARASFFTSNGSSVPIYRAGEVSLIKAEAHVRKSSPDLTAAVNELNVVLQKVPGGDAWGIGANLPAYSGNVTANDILDEIYKQRCIELFLSGLRLEDSRRFGRPASERGRDFLPYPFNERDNNINTPADPTN